MDGALARGDFSTATTARHRADLAALASTSWEGFLAVGDGALRLGEARGARSADEPEARRAYLSALIQARNARSLEGTLRVTDAFARLGIATSSSRASASPASWRARRQGHGSRG